MSGQQMSFSVFNTLLCFQNDLLYSNIQLLQQLESLVTINSGLGHTHGNNFNCDRPDTVGTLLINAGQSLPCQDHQNDASNQGERARS